MLGRDAHLNTSNAFAQLDIDLMAKFDDYGESRGNLSAEAVLAKAKFLAKHPSDWVRVMIPR